MTNLTPAQLTDIERRGDAAQVSLLGYGKNFCPTCGIIATDIPVLTAEIERLQGAVEASKDCGLIDGDPCPDINRICDMCEHNGYPDAVRKALGI